MDGGIWHFMIALALGIGLAATAGLKAFYLRRKRFGSFRLAAV